jgi:hypothetical protein
MVTIADYKTENESWLTLTAPVYRICSDQNIIFTRATFLFSDNSSCVSEPVSHDVNLKCGSTFRIQLRFYALSNSSQSMATGERERERETLFSTEEFYVLGYNAL